MPAEFTHRCARPAARGDQGEYGSAAERHRCDVQRRVRYARRRRHSPGWASVDFASNKPLVKLDLDFQRISTGDAARASRAPRKLPGTNSWSNAPIDLSGFNYVDAQARISTAELVIGDGRFAQAAIDALIDSGVLKGKLGNLGAYEGTANGDVSIDVRSATPAYSAAARPLRRARAAGAEEHGRIRQARRQDAGEDRADIARQQRARHRRRISAAPPPPPPPSPYSQDGKIIGLNVAQMIRNLTTGTIVGLAGGQQELSTDLSQLAACSRSTRARPSPPISIWSARW